MIKNYTKNEYKNKKKKTKLATIWINDSVTKYNEEYSTIFILKQKKYSGKNQITQSLYFEFHNMY